MDTPLQLSISMQIQERDAASDFQPDEFDKFKVARLAFSGHSYLRCRVTIGTDPKDAQHLGLQSPMFASNDQDARSQAFGTLMQLSAKAISDKYRRDTEASWRNAKTPCSLPA